MTGFVSVAMIVRDEAEHLAECLESVMRIADEVCLVDTGSTDGTPELARTFGIQPAYFPWQGDFAAARNHSLKLCAFPWIFVVDADERIATEDAATVRGLAQGPADRGYRFTTRNYTDDRDVSGFVPSVGDDTARGFAGWFPGTKVRLFPNRPDLIFEGTVHELVNPSIERHGLPIEECAAPIHHYPLMRTRERVQKKRMLYLELGRRKVAESPLDARARAELGNQLAELGDHAGAVASYRDALRLEPHDAQILKSLGAELHRLNRGPEAEHALRLALEIEPGLAEAWRNLGVIQACADRWPEALQSFERALALDPTWVGGLRYYSVALGHLGRADEACAAAHAALEANPFDNACLDNLLTQFRRHSRTDEARSILERLCVRFGDATHLRVARDSVR